MNPGATAHLPPAYGTVASSNLSGAVTTAIESSQSRREQLVLVADRLPPSDLQEGQKLLLWYDHALTRRGG